MTTTTSPETLDFTTDTTVADIRTVWHTTDDHGRPALIVVRTQAVGPRDAPRWASTGLALAAPHSRRFDRTIIEHVLLTEQTQGHEAHALRMQHAVMVALLEADRLAIPSSLRPAWDRRRTA